MNAWRLILVHRGAAGVLALLALTASLLVAGLPRSFEQAYDEALTARLDAVSAQQTDLTVALRPNTLDDQIATPAGFADLDADWRDNLPPLLRTAVQTGGTSHFSAKTYGTPVMDRIGSQAQARQYVDIAWVSGIEDKIRYVAGRPPGPPRTLAEVPGRPELKDIPYFEIGLVADADQRMRLPVGTKVLLANSYTVVAEVVGLFEPVDPEDRFWEHNERVQRILERRLPDDNLEYYATGLVPAEGLRFLDSRRELTYNWVLALDPASVNARNAPTMIEEIEDFRRYVTSQGGQEPMGPVRRGNARFDLDTGLDPLLAGYLAELRSAQTLVFLIIGGLVVVAIGVIALAVHLFSERMRGSLALARARGAALAQITTTGTAATALAAVPGALAGYALSFLVPGPVTPPVHLYPPTLALAAVGFAAVRLALTHRKPLTDSRADLVAPRPSPRRVAAEVLVIVLALAGAYALRSRGLSTDVAERGADPFLALVPAALTLAGALITLRCYPLPLRLVLRMAARRRGAVPFLGVTLAARSRGATSLPVLILLPALAVSVFGALVSGAIGETQRLAAWQHVGAQARVERAAEIPADVAAKVAALPGVTAVVPAAKGTVQLATGGQTATVLAINLDAYRSLVAGSPLAVPAAPTGPGIPALVSKSFAVYPEFEIGWHTRMKINNVGPVTELPGLAYPGNLIVMPYEGPKLAGLRTYTNMLLISGNVGREALEAAVGLEDAAVETFDETLGRISSAPLTGTITTGFTVVTVAMGGYALIAVILALVIGATDRSRTLSFLRTLGLSQGQARLLTVLEVAPLIVLTSLAGLAIGLGLPAALGPGLDLSAYAGIAVTDFPLTFTTPALLAAGLAAVSILGAFAHATAGRRMTTAIRVGESS